MTIESSHTSMSGRQIGIVGAVASAMLGIVLVGSVVIGHIGKFWLPPWILGLVVLPAVAVRAVDHLETRRRFDNRDGDASRGKDSHTS